MSTNRTEDDPVSEPRINFRRSKELSWHSYSLEPAVPAHAPQIQRILERYFNADELNSSALELSSMFSDGMFSVRTTARSHGNNVVGFHAFLPLSDSGRDDVVAGTFDGTTISADQLAPSFEGAVSLYWWMSAIKPSGNMALPLLEIALNRAPFAGKVLYVKPTTQAGHRASIRAGFSPLDPERSSVGDFFKLEPKVWRQVS
ncbi:MAG: hypothetical protein AAFQ29_07595 [Pseudomonadota bacterium]